MRQLRQHKSANAERFDTIFADTHAHVLAFVRRRIWDPHDVVDVVAEVYTVAWRRIESVPPGDEARLWLFRTAGYCIANFRRGVRRHARLGVKLASALERCTIEPPDDDNEDVRSALALLPTADREVLLMTAADGLSVADIAAILDISSDAVRARLSRARTRLRTLLVSQTVNAGHDDGANPAEVRK